MEKYEYYCLDGSELQPARFWSCYILTKEEYGLFEPESRLGYRRNDALLFNWIKKYDATLQKHVDNGEII